MASGSLEIKDINSYFFFPLFWRRGTSTNTYSLLNGGRLIGEAKDLVNVRRQDEIANVIKHDLPQSVSYSVDTIYSRLHPPQTYYYTTPS